MEHSCEDWLKSVSVSNEVLTIGAATMDTQTTYSAGAPRASLAVPTAASSATTVATGNVSATGGGATIATGSSGTDTVLGTASNFSVTNPTIAISTSGTTGPEVVGDVSDITVSPTYKYMSGSASGTAIGSDGTATVIGSSSTFTVTDPDVTVTPSTTYIKGTASGANTAWNNKDSVTVLDTNYWADKGKKIIDGRLASYLGVDRSAMHRELKHLQEEGLIEIKNKKITLKY